MKRKRYSEKKIIPILKEHQARLRRWLRTMRRLVSDSDDDYRPMDPHMARIVDLVDAVKGIGSL